MVEKRAFSQEFLGKLDRLVLGAKRARDARARRRNLGRVRGPGLELENFKEYQMGDDLRHLDWNALARLDNLLIRMFKPERQLELTILIDASASMGVPAGDDKLGLAFALGAGLAYVAMSASHGARIVVFSVRRGATKLEASPFYRRPDLYPELEPFLTRLKPGGETGLSVAVDKLLAERRPGGVVAVISDFLVKAADYEEALLHLAAARHEVKVVHVMGDGELAGNYGLGRFRVRDAESRDSRDLVLDEEARQICRQRAETHAAGLRDFCLNQSIGYARAFGASHLDDIIASEFPKIALVR
jgi:uncharacterized protein (DUF58 family)